MLKSHMVAKEKHLLAISQIPANAGHPLHKGTPREAFIREFLSDHLSETVAIGSGEIIDFDAVAGDMRNQLDVVIYRRNYPKLAFGGDVSGFLIESVVATIEVKSCLDKDGFRKAVAAARNVKSLKTNVSTSIQSGYQPPSVLSYVVAYDGPEDMKTVHGWVEDVYRKEGISLPVLPLDAEQRVQVPCPAVDGVFVLGKGFMYFDNVPYGFVTEEMRRGHPETRWAIENCAVGNLLLLFLFLTVAVGGMSVSWLNPVPYLKSFSLKGIDLSP